MNIVGKVKNVKLDRVAPNSWNPNVLDSTTYDSLKYGLQQDGWYASQAMLIWGTDEHGNTKNIIIDGEHRWRAGGELGFTTAPAVVLEGITEAKAKSLTIALDQKRGKFDQAKLADVLRDIQFSPVFEDQELAKALGFGDEELMKLLAVPMPELPPDEAVTGEVSHQSTAPKPPGEPAAEGTPVSNTRMLQLFLDETSHAVFLAAARDLAAHYGTANVTDTVVEAVRRARAELPPKT